MGKSFIVNFGAILIVVVVLCFVSWKRGGSNTVCVPVNLEAVIPEGTVAEIRVVSERI